MERRAVPVAERKRIDRRREKAAGSAVNAATAEPEAVRVRDHELDFTELTGDNMSVMMRSNTGDEGQSEEFYGPARLEESERVELERLRAREREIVELLGSTSPQRIIHDIRNVLNEARLLKYLADRND